MSFVTQNTYVPDFPILYQVSSNNSVKVWKISVEVPAGKPPVIVTEFGKLDGKQQVIREEITIGVNLNKTNATNPVEQALKNAESRFKRKLKAGYVKTKIAAQTGQVDTIIKGGLLPMLAHQYSHYKRLIQYPVYIQPKLDGIRCIAIKKGSTVTLWTRTRKRITSCPHIEKDILELYGDDDVVLDGELYNHALKDNFEGIVAAVRRTEATEASEQVQYHLFDVVATHMKYTGRQMLLPKASYKSLQLVKTDIAESEEDVQMFWKKHTDMGYEGSIIRDPYAGYIHGRTSSLLKVKEFQDAEFRIIGVKEGKGKLKGTLGAFICETRTGETFEVKMTGSQEENKKYLTNKKTWQGKELTVQFQAYTVKNHVPRFPVGLRIREKGL